MKSFFIYLFIGMLCALLQSSFFPLLLPVGFRPNLLLILILFLSLGESMFRALVLTLLLGGIQDSFSGTTLGLYLSVNLALLLLVRLLSKHLNAESSSFLLLLIAGGSIIQNLLVGFCLTTFADAGPVMQILLTALPQQLLVNLLAAGIMLSLYLRIHPLLGSRSGLAGLIYQSKRYGP